MHVEGAVAYTNEDSGAVSSADLLTQQLLLNHSSSECILSRLPNRFSML